VAALFRVFPYNANTAVDEPGGALFIPPQGGGRLDNPSSYSVLYLSNSGPGAIAEGFGRFPEWGPGILCGVPGLPGSVRAIARYRIAEETSVCDLDDPARLVNLALRPSEVVSRDYAQTRAWALRIYQQNIWAGIRWWSYYNPAWSSIGLWDIKALIVEDIAPLRLDNPDLLEAGRSIVRRIVR
jgi:hypothetical protein